MGTKLRYRLNVYIKKIIVQNLYIKIRNFYEIDWVEKIDAAKMPNSIKRTTGKNYLKTKNKKKEEIKCNRVD